MQILSTVIEFEWDTGNQSKNLIKHSVTDQECEEVFFDENKKIFPDTPHSDIEERYILLGKTKQKRLLFVIFTVRENKVRVISARPLNKKEKKLYEETT